MFTIESEVVGLILLKMLASSCVKCGASHFQNFVTFQKFHTLLSTRLLQLC
jgi:hypothetical protein